MEQKNPFKFGDPVEGAYYLPRMQLEHLVSQFVASQIHLVLIGPRRMGKTSFLLNLLQSWEREGRYCLFIDIFNITSHKDFLQQLLRALRTKQSWLARLKEWIESVPKLRPKISTEIEPETHHLSLGLTVDAPTEPDVKELIQDLLAGLDRLGKEVVVVIDEFQQVAQIDDQGWLEATLRTHMQQLKNTVFLLTGSRRSMIYDMLNNQSRPLYRSCQPIEFPSFGREFTAWVVARFASVGIVAEPEAINTLRKLVQDIPNYVQMVCFHLVAEGQKLVDQRAVEETLAMVVRQNAYAYQTLLHSLTAMQQRALRLTASEEPPLFAKQLLAKYEISSGPALASALKALKEKQILDEEASGRGRVIFDDPLFAFWLRLTF